MKKLYAILAVLALFFIGGCQPDNPTGNTKTKEKEKLDPELSISGVPTSDVGSGSAFTVTISSKSKGAITLSVDKPSVAIPEKLGDTEYRISAAAVNDTKVKISVSQEADGDYNAGKASASFKVLGSGSEDLPGPDEDLPGTGISYVEAEGEVVSPERGMYLPYFIDSSSKSISSSDIKSNLSKHSLWLLEFSLHEFMTGSISQKYLDNVQKNFDAIRNGGAKAIVRFAYVWDDKNWQNVDQEPEVEIVLKHVEQLKPVLQKNEDVLFALQAGFVGTWGEWYYTTHFNYRPSGESGYAPRKQLTEALLDAVPASRQIQLRTPTFKMKMYNLAVADTLTSTTGHDGSKKSRLAGHNDCFMSSPDDQGTFDGDETRTFWKGDTRYAIMGGETCDPSTGNENYCNCDNSRGFLEEDHWTYLNEDYSRKILGKWESGNCMAEFKSRLGYRLVLKDVHYENLKAGERCKVTIRLFNKGFAAPMNPREAWLVWVTSDGKVEKTLLGADPRTWYSGYNAVVSYFTPSTAKGTLYIELSDPLLKDNPAYSLKLANKDIFDKATGYNKLFEIK